MRRRIGIGLLAVAVVWCAATAEARPRAGGSRTRARVAKTAADDLLWISVGNLGALVTNYGRIGDADTPEQASYEWPLGSRNYYLFEGRIWFGVGGTKYVSTGEDLEWGTDAAAPDDTIRQITGEDAIGDLDTYAIYTDLVPQNSYQIGIKVYQHTSTWTASYLDDIIMYDMTFENISGNDLTGVFIGTAMDCDISALEGSENYLDDLTYWMHYKVGTQMRFISYEYDSDHPEIPGDDTGGPNGESRGYLGTSPLMVLDEHGTDILPTLIAEGSPTITHYWWDWNHDPDNDALKYDYMASQVQLPTPPSPFDYRYMQAYGPFTMASGATLRVKFVIGIGEGLGGLKENMDAFHDLFNANRTTEGKWKGAEGPTAPTVALTPGSGRVTIRWSAASEAHIDPVSNTADFAGYRVWKSRTGVEGSWTLVADYDKVDDYGLNTGLPAKVGGMYEYVDTQVHDGFSYWYAVTAYDRGDQQIGVLESSQNSNKLETFPGPTGDNSGANIYVYPNPYQFQSTWDPTPNPQQPAGNRIRFNNIPGHCTIRVFTMSGDLVTTLDHTDGNGYQDWDLMSDRPQPQKIVAGVYLYSIRGDGVDHVGKFVVLR